MVVTIDIKNINLSRVSVFSGGGGGTKRVGNGGGILEDVDDVCTLSYKQRLYGFIGCFLAGAVIAGLSYVSLYLGRLPTFVVLFSIGNLIALCSTMFLMGPMNQLRRMFDPVRIVATIVYLTFVCLTIYFGMFSKLKTAKLLALLCGVIEVFALIWYSLSYIPYARSLLCKCLGL